MVGRVVSKLSYANVVATIALFAALGGGYAVAFSGSGTLQKAARQGFPGDGSFRTVRTLTGIGSIKASCTGTIGNPELHIVVHSSEFPYLFGRQTQDGAAVTGPSGVDGGQDSSPFEVPTGPGYFELYVRRGGDAKRRQAEVLIGWDEGDISCSSAEVSVLALNTEQ